jgi:hypothetical protein
MDDGLNALWISAVSFSKIAPKRQGEGRKG